MRFRLTHHSQEFECPTCGAPVYVGDAACQARRTTTPATYRAATTASDQAGTMIRDVMLRHTDGRTAVIQTAMNDTFLERMFPGWRVVSRS